jgi:ribosome-binding protein aMBF1 (putative translation factor)
MVAVYPIRDIEYDGGAMTDDGTPADRRHESVFPGFRDMAARRQRMAAGLVELRRASGLSQTEVAARMGTSQSAVARLESGLADVRLSTLDRYAAALGQQLDIGWREEQE